MGAEFIELGTSGIQVSKVIMGTWQAGKEMWAGIEDETSIAAIRAAVDAGITTFDTAEAYGRGHSERILGQALKDVRHQVVIATKAFPTNLAYDKLIDACNRSLKNLQTDVIDLYQIHWPAGVHGSRHVPIEKTMAGLNRLKADGKIRSIGVSNFSVTQLDEASQYGRIDSLQPPYSLLWRHFESEAQSYCQQNDITVLAYSPMAQGLLTAKFGPDHRFARGDHRIQNKLFAKNQFERVQQALAQLKPIAQKKHISMAQLALAWVQAHAQTCAIAGARNTRQVKENAAAMEIVLTAEELEQMDIISQQVTNHLDDNPILWNF